MDATRPDPLAHLTGQLHPGLYPPGISLPGEGGKFHTDGTAQIWPGTTFLCQPDPQSAAVLTELQEAVKLSPFAPLFVFMPPPSLHITICQGTGPDPIAARDAHAKRLAEATRGIALPQSLTLRATEVYGGNSLTLSGATPGETETVAAARAALLRATGRPSQTAPLHLTLGYLLHWLSPATAARVVAFSAELEARFLPRLAEIRTGPVRLCRFNSLHGFETVGP